MHVLDSGFSMDSTLLSSDEECVERLSGRDDTTMRTVTSTSTVMSQSKTGGIDNNSRDT